MITSFLCFLGFVALIIILALVFQFYLPKTVNKSNLTIDEIVKHFNKLIKSINGRNIDTVKEELFVLLSQYKNTKEKEFSDALCKIRKSIISLKESKDNLQSKCNELHCKILEAKRKELPNSVGAALVYQKEQFEQMVEDLNVKIAEMQAKENTIDSKINKFNADYAIKQAQITLMVCNASTLNNYSNIDIKLDDLVTEFNDKVTEAQVRSEVHEKIHGVQKEDSYDEASYIEKFKTY